MKALIPLQLYTTSPLLAQRPPELVTLKPPHETGFVLDKLLSSVLIVHDLVVNLCLIVHPGRQGPGHENKRVPQDKPHHTMTVWLTGLTIQQTGNHAVSALPQILCTYKLETS